MKTTKMGAVAVTDNDECVAVAYFRPIVAVCMHSISSPVMNPGAFLRATLLLCSTASLLVACSSSATVSRMQTSNFYPTKNTATAIAYIPAELRGKQLTLAITTETCGGWTAELDAGNGVTTAIFSGLTAAIEVVHLVDSLPTPAMAAARGASLMITVVPAGESSSITATEGSSYPTLSAQYQLSIDITVADVAGGKPFRFAANGTGFNTAAGPCNVAATVMKTAVEMALKQVSDWVAQSVHGMRR